MNGGGLGAAVLELLVPRPIELAEINDESRETMRMLLLFELLATASTVDSVVRNAC